MTIEENIQTYARQIYALKPWEVMSENQLFILHNIHEKSDSLIDCYKHKEDYGLRIYLDSNSQMAREIRVQNSGHDFSDPWLNFAGYRLAYFPDTNQVSLTHYEIGKKFAEIEKEVYADLAFALRSYLTALEKLENGTLGKAPTLNFALVALYKERFGQVKISYAQNNRQNLTTYIRSVDSSNLRKIKEQQKVPNQGSYEIALTFLPQILEKKEQYQQYYPLLTIIDHQNGAVLYSEKIKEDPLRDIGKTLQILAKQAPLPKRILFAQLDYCLALEKLCKEIDIESFSRKKLTQTKLFIENLRKAELKTAPQVDAWLAKNPS